MFDLYCWYSQHLVQLDKEALMMVTSDTKYWLKLLPFVCNLLDKPDSESASTLDLNCVQVDQDKYPALQWNAAQIKGNCGIIPKLIVV